MYASPGITSIGAATTAKVALNTVIPLLTKLFGFISDISKIGSGVTKSVEGFFGHLLGGGGSSNHNVKKGAIGGFVNKPTMLLAGEAGPEVLLPLNNPARMAQLIGSIATPLPASGGGMALNSATGNVAGVPGAAPPTMGNSNAPQVNVYAQTNADPHAIAAEVGWVLRTHK